MNKSLDIATRQLLEKVIEDNLDYLVRFATIRLGSKADAEDVVHESIRRILDKDLSRINRANFRMYLFRIVYNLCKDQSSRSKSSRPLEEKDYQIADTAADTDADREEIDRLNRLLEILPDREAEVVRMNVMDELSFVEISHILTVPESTIKSRFKSGMDKLRKQYFKNQ